MNKNDEQLKFYKTAYPKLQDSFKNNLNVIKELQQENNDLQKHLHQISIKYESQLQRSLLALQQKHRKNIQDQQLAFGREIDLVKKQYQDIIMSITQNSDKKTQQLVTSITKKHKGQTQSIRNLFSKQLDSQDLQIKKYQNKNKILQQSLTNTQKSLNQSSIKNLSLQSQIQHLQRQKKQSQTLYSNYQQELQTLKNSNNSWEDILKIRIKQLEQQKSSLQEQMAEIRLSNKEKVRKLKQEYNKKITHLQQTNSTRLNEISRETKQIKFKFQTIKQQNLQLKNQNQQIKRQSNQLQKEIQQEKLKFSQAQNSLLTVRQKEFEIKSLNQEKKRLLNQIKTLSQQKNQLKQDYQKINFQRQNAEKALERLKVQLINKTRQNQDMRKQIQKIKYKTQINTYQPQNLEIKQQINANNGLAKYDKKDGIKGQVDYSQCFTEDMGPVDQNFFFNQNSGMYRSPQKPLNTYTVEQIAQIQQQEQSINKIPHLMKRIGQLQVQSSQYKSTIKTLKDQMQRTSHLIQQKLILKDKQIRLNKDENLMIRQKLNDKEQTILNLNQTIRNLKNDILDYKKMSQQIKQAKGVKDQNQELKKQLSEKQIQISELKEQIQNLIQERQTLQQIADDLRAEVNIYKDQQNYQIQQEESYNRNRSDLRSKKQNQSHVSNLHRKQISSNTENNYSNNYSNKFSRNIDQVPRHPTKQESQNRSNIVSRNQFKNPEKRSPAAKLKEQTKGQKRKLHQLIKQKNALEAEGGLIAGKKATLQRRSEQERAQHVGTQSQKQIYERLQKKSKSKSKQKPVKLRDFRVQKPQHQVSQNKLHFIQKVQQNKSYITDINPSSMLQSQGLVRRKSALQELRQQNLKKKQTANNIRNQMMRNDSLNSYENLENVSMGYWEQQLK